MTEANALRRDLLARIDMRRAAVQAFFLRKDRPHLRHSTNLTIVLSLARAAFTAGPALGGEPFAESVQRALGAGHRRRRVAAAVPARPAGLRSAAAVLTNIAKSQDSEARLSTVEAVNAELEGLASACCTTATSRWRTRVKLYQQYTAKIPFVEDVPAYTYGAPQGWGQPPGSWGRAPPGGPPPGGWAQQ